MYNVLGGWMNMPQGPPNCPPGLEYLTMIDQLLVHQKVEILEGKHCSQSWFVCIQTEIHLVCFSTDWF